MPAIEMPVNGYARFSSADFSAKACACRQEWLPNVGDPLAEIAARQHGKRTKDELAALVDEILKSAPEGPRKLPPFPLPALPPALRAWVEAESRQSQTSPDVAAMLALAVSSAALAKRAWIAAGSDRPEPVNLYVALLLDGGERGGDVLEDAVRPLRDLEFDEIEQAQRGSALDRLYQERARADLAARKKEYARYPDATQSQKLEADQIDLALHRAAAPPRRLLSEVHARAIHQCLGDQGGTACFSADGEIFRQLAGRSSASRDRLVDLLEAMHSARDLLAELPKRRVVPVRRATVTCASIVGPALVAQIAGQRQMPGRTLLARFLFVAPETNIGRREAATPMPDDIAARYRAGIRRLATGVGGCMSLAPEAEIFFREWQGEIESQLGDGGRLAPIRLWAGHLAGATLRIAAILHSWSGEPLAPLPRETLVAAIEIGRYLLAHAAHALESLGGADDDCTGAERSLLRYARSAEEFSRREAMLHLRKTMVHRAALDRALAGLMRRGYLRPIGIEPAATGRPASPRFALATLPLWQEEGSDAKSSESAEPRENSGENEMTESHQNLAEGAGEVSAELSGSRHEAAVCEARIGAGYSCAR